MAIRTGTAVWEGTIKDGQGIMELGKGKYREKYSFSSRFEEGNGTNPEELIATAHAGCFSMALAMMLGNAGFPPKKIATKADVTIENTPGGFAITFIKLITEANVPGIAKEDFIKIAGQAKRECPVSKALAGVPVIELEAKLV